MPTALDSKEQQLRGFDMDIDDDITKPFSMPVLLEKIRAILHWSGGLDEATCVRYGDLLLPMN